MAKTDSQKLWERAHPEKKKEYNKRYLSGKTRIIVTLSAEGGELIDKLKDPSETRTEWVKKVVLNAIANGTEP